jgi:subtilisin family serine protease
MKNKNYFLIIFLVAVIISMQGFSNSADYSKLSKILREELSLKDNNSKTLIWITFTDKGINSEEKLLHPEKFLTQRAIDRRMKVKPINALVDFTDLPVNNEYVNELKNYGLEIKNKSKWFNSVSCYATKTQIEQITENDFVKNADIVRVYRKSETDTELNSNNPVIQQDNSGSGNESQYLLNYGSSLEQMQLINAPTAHDSGYAGQGVIIASLDAGFDNLQHPVFDSLRARGFRSYDFVNHDTIVGNQNGQMGEGSHGTQTLSLVGGYKPGSLISPAYKSKFILALTENTDSETPLEEDNWIAAAEWVDSLGADIITSSLGYLAMDPGSIRTYDWTWMNGDSCIITIGADLAVNKGIIVCNSAGNEGFHATHNTLGAPADGDSVITVGSVNTNKNRSSFSSVGNTTDGRIKPDVCALGNGNFVAAPGAGNTGYTSGSGTSFSCPMTAGVCAVILSANHNLTPMQVRQLLRQTADSSFAPNRRRGWGLINCWEAVKLARNITGAGVSNSFMPEGYSLSQNYPNPFNPVTKINYTIPSGVNGERSNVKLIIYNNLGMEVKTLVNETQGSGNYEVNFNGENLSSGVYFYALRAGNFTETKKMTLLK